MSSLIFAAPFRTKVEGPTTAIEFEATPREVHSGRSDPTDHPVEDGSTISDHSIDQPDEVEIQGMISNRPIIIGNSIRGEGSVQGGDGDTRNRAEKAFAEIKRLRKTKTLVTLATELEVYEDFLIVSESAQREPRTGKILDITVRFREFRTATVERREIPEPIDPVDKPDRDLGAQQAVEAPANVSEKSTNSLSALEAGATAIGAALGL